MKRLSFTLCRCPGVFCLDCGRFGVILIFLQMQCLLVVGSSDISVENDTPGEPWRKLIEKMKLILSSGQIKSVKFSWVL
jgi:hypothetical protein